MTVSVTPTYTRAAGNGVTTVFNFAFKIFNATDLVVRDILDSTGTPTVRTLTTDYSVSIASAGEGGTVTMVAAPASGHTLDIRSVIPLAQGADIRNQGRFLPEIHEGVFDKLQRQIQDVSRRVDASFRYPDYVVQNGALDPISAWFSKYLTINSAGVLEAAVLSSSTVTASVITALLTSSVSEQDNLIALILARSDNVPVLADRIRTAAEISAGITPVNYAFPASPAWVRRYGAVLDGTTDDLTALNAAISVAASSSFEIVIDGPLRVSNNVTIPSNVTTHFIGTGAFKIDTGKTITHNGTVIAEPRNIFQNALAGQGTVAFSTNKQRCFYFEWWGATGNSVTNDYPAMLACISQASNAQSTIQLVGSYLFSTSLTMPQNVELVGYGKNFGTQLILNGNVAINFTGSSQHSVIRRTVVEAAACTATACITFAGGAGNCVVEDVFVHGMNTLGGNVCGVQVGTSQNVELNRVSVTGSGGGGIDGIIVTSGAVGALLSGCNPQACFRGIKVTGTGQADIIGNYFESCSGYSYYIDRAGAGSCTIVGGHIDVANAGAQAIGIASTASNVTIFKPNIVLNGGTGIAPVGGGPFSNILIIGVPAANVADPGNLFSIITDDKIQMRSKVVAGFGTPTGAAVVANYPGATATLVQTSNTVAEILLILKSLGIIAA